MKVETKGYKIICDSCGKQFETIEGFSCYCDDPKGDLIEEASDSADWMEFNGRHYCPDCYSYDDDDNIVTKDGRKFDGETYEEIV